MLVTHGKRSVSSVILGEVPSTLCVFSPAWRHLERAPPGRATPGPMSLAGRARQYPDHRHHRTAQREVFGWLIVCRAGGLDQPECSRYPLSSACVTSPVKGDAIDPLPG
jgi:hypothetical protein